MSRYLLESIKNNLVKSIKKSPETMDFLIKQSREAFDECKINWIVKQTKEEAENKELWCEYHYEAHKKIEKYIGRWICDLANHFYIEKGKFPDSIISNFEFIILEFIEYIEPYFSNEITVYLMEIFCNEEKEEYEANNLQGNKLP